MIGIEVGWLVGGVVLVIIYSRLRRVAFGHEGVRYGYDLLWAYYVCIRR